MTKPPEPLDEKTQAIEPVGTPPRTEAELSDSQLESVSGGMSHGIAVTPAPPSPVPIPYPNLSKL